MLKVKSKGESNNFRVINQSISTIFISNGAFNDLQLNSGTQYILLNYRNYSTMVSNSADGYVLAGEICRLSRTKFTQLCKVHKTAGQWSE